MNVKLFTTADCRNCPGIKKQLDEAGIKYETVDVTSDLEAREELLSYGVRGVPYLVATNGYGSEYKALGNAITVKSLSNFLESKFND